MHHGLRDQFILWLLVGLIDIRAIVVGLCSGITSLSIVIVRGCVGRDLMLELRRSRHVVIGLLIG